MGLFGSDKRPQQSTPQPQQPAVSRPQSGPQSGSDGGSTLSKNCKVDGVITCSDDLTIQGELKGRVSTTGHLVVAQSGRVEAEVHGHTVSVAGSVAGDISADERIELEPAAKVRGNITAPRIMIKDGATFEGQVFMKSPGTPQPKPADKPAAPAAETKPDPGVADKGPKNKGR